MFENFWARFLMSLSLVGVLFTMYSSATSQVRFETSIVGTWEGTLTAGGAKLRVVFHLVKNDSGTLAATLDSPDQGVKGIAVNNTTVSGDSVILTVASIGGSYIGRISDDKSTIEGTWNQSGASFGLALNRTTASAATVKTSADTSIVGMWQGALDAGGVKLRIVFHVVKNDSCKFVSTLDSPDQGANGIPVSSTTVNGDSVIFTVASIGGSYIGRISVDRSYIEGKWGQNGASFDLSLNRTTTAIKFIRPQEPKPPFPYRSEEVSFENETTGLKYAGTLTLPDSGALFPAVILITGSGAHDRNEEIFGHKPFLVIADYLTRRGIAVLRVDDRGIGGSTGKKMTVTSADHAKDVIAEIEFLKSRRDIDPNKIGLIGHSEGGIIAPLVASQSKDIAFIVMLAGPGLPGGDIIKMQTRLIEEADSIPPGRISQDVGRTERITSIIKSGKDSISIADQIRSYLKATISEWGGAFSKSGSEVDTEKAIGSQINQLDGPWYRYFITHDPRPTLEAVKCPVLAMGGTLDLQVPANEDLKEIEKALQKGGNKNHTIKLMPGLNHLFQDATTGSPKEYTQIEETFSPAALKVLGDWIEGTTSKK